MRSELSAEKGFTVVELIVAFGLFAIVLSIVTGTFIKSLRTQQQITAFIAANSNASLTIEQIAREIRTGQDFCVDPNAVCELDNGDIYNDIVFTNARGQQVKYSLAERTIGSNVIQSIMRSVDGGQAIPVTADNVNIQRLKFYLSGQETADGQNPKITIVLGAGSPSISFADLLINLQTTISSRILQT